MNKVDFMIFNIKKDEWTWISEIKSGEFMYKNTLVKVFTSNTGVVFFQTKWGNTTYQTRNCLNVFVIGSLPDSIAPSFSFTSDPDVLRAINRCLASAGSTTYPTTPGYT